jgi:hypothetical protein
MRLLSDTAAWFSSVRVVLALGAAALAGCTEVESESETGYEPSKLRKTHVEFTPEGAKRTGLRTENVERTGRRVSVPYAALLYDPEGKTYVYTSPKELHYVKAEVRVARVESGRVVLARGPPPGTRVVTTGAAEVYGTELEVPAK